MDSNHLMLKLACIYDTDEYMVPFHMDNGLYLMIVFPKLQHFYFSMVGCNYKEAKSKSDISTPLSCVVNQYKPVAFLPKKYPLNPKK